MNKCCCGCECEKRFKYINSKTNTWYLRFKILSAFFLGIEYFWLLYGYNPNNKLEVGILLAFTGITFVSIFLQSKKIDKILSPLIQYEPSEEEGSYVDDLMNYVKKGRLAVTIELVLVILAFLILIISYFNSGYFLKSIHNHQAIPITLVGTALVYLFSYEADIDLVYLKYFRTEYLEYMKKYYS
ncbi:hypothetical protein LME01_11160 [Leuconostoc mesenteroides subsp. mesenteroides]|nr:hypothetical protein LME01_11160 [Leuconostoc mesenteroides subsp. mesenteroides]